MSGSNTFPVGDIQFLDNCVPGLTEGEYQINVTHSISEPSYSIDSSFNGTQSFIVNGPRFALTPGTVQSCFPSPNAEKDFHETLPFIVFNDRFLPWNIALQGGNTTYPPSWMALMIFKNNPGDCELIYTTPPAPAQPNPTLSTVRPVNDILNPPAGTLGPQIVLNDYEQTLTGLSATTIDVLGTTFQELAPQLAELPYLAHVRQINTGGQTIDGLCGDGLYSVILGNRLPYPVPGSGSSSSPVMPSPMKYIAHLVSLEGWENYLPGGSSSFAAGEAARLISLNSWTFTSDPAGPDFTELVSNLSVGPLCLPLDPPKSWSAPAAVQTEITNKYTNGYVGLNYTTRLGQNTLAWYRGPFNPNVPYMIQNSLPGYFDNGAAPITTPDEAIIYDPTFGAFDLSYAVAFETGRMVTLANKTAALAVWNWKKDGISLLQILNNLVEEAEGGTGSTRLSLRRKAKAGAAGITDWEAIKIILKDIHAGPRSFLRYLSKSFGRRFTNYSAKKHLEAIQVCDPSKLSSHNDPGSAAKHLPGLLSPAELEELSATGQDPYVFIIEKLNRTIKQEDI
jgi:hypothetical protein